MELFGKLLKRGNEYQLILVVLLVVYITFNIETPPFLADMIDNVYGNVVVMALALSLFFKCDPIVSVVGLLAAYELIKRSSEKTGTAAIQKYLPSELKKGKHFSAFNQFPVTLEEEVVSEMAPLVKGPPTNANYKPALDGQHDAASVHYDGVI